MAKVRFEITGDMPDDYAEIVLGVLSISGMLQGHQLTKRKNEDGGYTVILHVTGRRPPLGSIGLGDIPDEND